MNQLFQQENQETAQHPISSATEASSSKNQGAADHSYAAWVKEFDTVGASERIVLRRDLRALRRHPLISVVMPVYNPDLTYLSSAIDSVRSQIYENWELCVADDASTDESVAPMLRQYAVADSRIKATFRERNGHIAACSKSATKNPHICGRKNADQWRTGRLFNKLIAPSPTPGFTAANGG